MSRVFERPRTPRSLLPKPHDSDIPSAFAIETLHSVSVQQPSGLYASSDPPFPDFELPAMPPITRSQIVSPSVDEPPMSTPGLVPRKPIKSIRKTRLSLPEKGQKRINFTTKVDQRHDVPAITKMLSQYAILENVASYVSSADLVHLAATNKEHRLYITSSKPLYDRFKESAICDGKGLKSRAHCFGHFNGDPSNAKIKCREGDCKPCCKCKAMVCQHKDCRYHMQYFDDVPCCADDEEHYSYHEHMEASDAWCEYLLERDEFRGPIQSPEFSLEMLKALEIGGKARERRFCSDCRPYFEHSAFWLYLTTEEMQTEYDGEQWCVCDAPSRFLHELPWLCIPCFTLMQTEAAGRRIGRIVYTIGKNLDTDSGYPLIRTPDGWEYLCDCGKPALKDDIVQCRWCKEFVEFDDWEFKLSKKSPRRHKKKL